MVTLKKHTTAAKELAKAGRYMRSAIVQSRLKKLDASSIGGVGKASLMQLKSARRTDQRSTFSIACSSGTASRSTGGRKALTRGDVTASPLDSIRRPPGAAAGVGRRLLTRKSASGHSGGYSGSHSGGHSGGGRDFARTNSGASNSIRGGAESPTKATTADETAVNDSLRQARTGRRSNSTHRGKTVSITASQDGQTLSSRMFMVSNSDLLPMKRSIIKMRPLPVDDHLIASHNQEATPREGKPEARLTPHQIKEQKIFRECRFVPVDTFYKKVVVAPNQERQFFAAPKCSRVYGTRFLYDIAGENGRHHQDVNFDFTRESLRRACPNYLRPSNFRHNY